MSDLNLTPTRFYALADLLQEQDHAPLEAYLDALGKLCEDVGQEVRMLASANEALVKEAALTTRRSNPFDVDQRDPLQGLRHSVADQNFIRVIYEVVDTILAGYKYLLNAAKGFKTTPIQLYGVRLEGPPQTYEEIQVVHAQMQMGQSAIEGFINGINLAEKSPNLIVEVGRRVALYLDSYYESLHKRHTVEGIEIHGDPVTTDIALSIYENVDASGEIQGGTDPNEVSVYSMSRAVLIADTISVGLVQVFVERPEHLMVFIEENLRLMWDQAKVLADLANPVATKIRKIRNTPWDRPHVMSADSFERALTQVRFMDPRQVQYKERGGLMTLEERRELAFRNETIKLVVEKLRAGTKTSDLIRVILDRKKRLRDYHLEENSFFGCKIGAGNSFSGEAPGQLKVIPAPRPNVVLTDIVGSGFDEVRGFIEMLKAGADWTDLFQATSPSKKTDKSNVLLVGPQGCGKTEVLRAVGSDRGSIAIFAQASDFLTCWKGEAEKNPKRLFEAGLKLQRESGRDVHFLIDEIDTILNSAQGQNAFGGFNLATEFQVLMDGVMSYPGLSVWGATNHLERIPMPLVRRFAKVVIVGELSQADRVHLLRHFSNFLPVDPLFSDQAWEDAAQQLDGAVGDIMRKVVDDLWRKSMSTFVGKHPDVARELVRWLNRDGVKFDISTFDADRRAAFKEKLRPYVELKEEDVLSSVKGYLGNIAIQGEIAKCKATYEGARRTLASLSARAVPMPTEIPEPYIED